MALDARYGEVSSRQRKFRRFVPCQRIRGGFEATDHMAALAAIVPRCPRELSLVDVGVAVPALRRLDFVKGVEPLGDMALLASHRAVLSFQGIGCVLVQGHRKGGGFEALNGVARGALTAIFAGIELPMVRVVVMAIQAFLKGNGPVQIPSQVAQFAAHPRMFSQQGILCGGMVKSLTHRRRGNLFPSRRGMAGLACRLKNAMMDVGVAIIAGIESEANVFDDLRMFGLRLMALLAGQTPVLPG